MDCENCTLRGDEPRIQANDDGYLLAKFPHHVRITDDLLVQIAKRSNRWGNMDGKILEFRFRNAYARYALDAREPNKCSTWVLLVGWGPLPRDFDPGKDFNTLGGPVDVEGLDEAGIAALAEEWRKKGAA